MKQFILITHESPYFSRGENVKGRNVPIGELAKVIGKDAQFIRIGLQKGILNFGCALKKENSSEFNYYCPNKKVWEETGYFRG